MITYRTYSQTQWLSARTPTIGGSDAAAVMGMHPNMSNIDLWEIKTGRKEQTDISERDFVKYGTEAENHLRNLFALDYPQYALAYEEGNIWHNTDVPFAHASLDGWLTDEQGRRGILEIKTTNILNSQQKTKWQNRIPDNYYCQLLHYFMVTDFDFAILKAQLKYDYDDIFIITKHYHVERCEVESDIELLAKKEEDFCRYMEENRRPPLVLPPI